MGVMVNGEWRADEDFPRDASGHFVRPVSPFRNWVTADGSPGPSGSGGFHAAAGRYHLIVSLACPWAHRALIVRKLKGLESMISLSVVNWLMAGRGWTFDPGPGVIADPLFGFDTLADFYRKARPDFTGRVTVPVLWDRDTNTIVSNESSEIIRMFNSAFDAVGAAEGDYYPEDLRGEIDALNDRIYATVNNGVYRAGFATSQDAYEEAFRALFETLDWLDARLTVRQFLAGDRLTEADWRLFTTLVRFDPVYFGHFKCNLKQIRDYPALSRYLRELYRWPGVAETVDFFHIKHHYYESHRGINPTGIVPLGPEMAL
ncbi:putative glutathione S-transferase [Roseiarcus fermentans]|uniref:Putative glutathione S-transferase n=1 Tax=Roseiarcus fermentans TaxID=1473586 RepID=A0A366FA31_9HYPH|nr:glutathione S-transferase family protein [Roseiarcus fermentans]RBP10575.1 putative glutathione S-transferase [Roseiarcus fermentans]